MQTSLIALATEIGAPLVKKILARQIGGTGGELAGQVIDQIAAGAGIAPDKLDQAAATDRDALAPVISKVEQAAPEMIALYAAGLEGQFELARIEASSDHWFAWAWRPAGMWGLGFLWIWNLVILHVANAIWKIALPQTDPATLIQLSALYMGLYMGGHTLKDFVNKKWGAS